MKIFHELRALADKLVFITGAGSVIGRKVCKLFAQEGATLFVTDKRIECAVETLNYVEDDYSLQPPNFSVANCACEIDVTNRKSVESAFQHVIEKYNGPPSIVINAANIMRSDNILDLSDDKFDEVIKVNLKGTFLVMQTAAKIMIQSKLTANFSIINLSSIFGKLGCFGDSNYSASNAGIIALTKCAAMEFEKFGIRVNAILPGYIYGNSIPMLNTLGRDDYNKVFKKQVLLGRYGYPLNVANVILFLASEESSYINGASIEVTGGI